MPYNVRTYSQFKNGEQGSTIADLSLVENTYSIPIVGVEYENFAQPMAEAILWMCSNFYGFQSPSNPIIGQTWFDSNTETLNVYDINGQWVEITSSTYQPLAISEDVTPFITDTYTVGSLSNRYSTSFINRVYVDTLEFGNAYSSHSQNITIDANGNSGLKLEDNLYPAVDQVLFPAGSVSDDIDYLLDAARSSSAVPWTSTYATSTIVEVDGVNIMPIDPLTNLNVAIIEAVNVPVTFGCTINIPDLDITDDTQLLVLTQPGYRYRFNLPDKKNYNFISRGSVFRFYATWNFISGTPTRLSFLRTEDPDTFDVLITGGELYV